MPSECDLVVVGAGSAGCVVASRVSDAGGRVLLLEAGPDYPDPVQLPTDLRNGNHNSMVDHDWGFTYRPRSSGAGVPFPRGRVVGGSSAVNTCIALRGEPADYDEWASIAGDEWCWDRCLPAFVRLESDRDFADEPYHGSDGPLPIGRYPQPELQPIQAAFLGAWHEAGLERCEDHNAPGSTGAGRTPLNKRGHDRVSVAEAYLTPERRARIAIRPSTAVGRVVFAGTAVRGVELVGGEVVECPSVVVACGAIATPPLLVRSGIGPRETLDRLGIDAVSVRDALGARLLDHPGTALVLRCDERLVDMRSPLMQACARTTVSERNDLFLEPLSFVAAARSGRASVGIALSAYRSHGAGRLVVDSADVDACPSIESAFYDDGHDVDLMVAGLRKALELASTHAIGELKPEFVGTTPDSSEDDLRRHVLRFSGSGYHPCGTARMGHPEDPQAVCDGYGRVIGVSGLRVADASIMPVVPRCNINIPTVMIGERFGEWLAAEV